MGFRRHKKLAIYADITSSASACVPTAIPAYSQNPPIVAPIRFDPNDIDGEVESRNVVEKISPAKKIGNGTISSAHASRNGNDCPSTQSRGTKYKSSSDASNGKYNHDDAS